MTDNGGLDRADRVGDRAGIGDVGLTRDQALWPASATRAHSRDQLLTELATTAEHQDQDASPSRSPPIGAGADPLPPVAIVEIPAHRRCQPGLERLPGLPAEFPR